MSFTPGPGTTYLLTSTQPVPTGTANGVLYLNGSKVVTSGSALQFSGTDLTVNLDGSSLLLGTGGAATAAMSFRSTTRNQLRFPSGASFEWHEGVSERMRLTSTGLGIGTTSAAGRLDVDGAAYIGDDSNNALFIDSTSSTVTIGAAGRTSFSTSALRFLTSDGSAALERMRLDSSGNLGLGVTPSAWNLGKAFEINFIGNSLWGATTTQLNLLQNAYWNGGYKYANSVSSPASFYSQINGTHTWHIAGSGTAGNPISFTQAMTLDASGNLGIGATSPGRKLHVVSNNPLRMGQASDYFDFVQSSTNLWSWLSNLGTINLQMNGATGAVVIGGLVNTTATDGFLYVPTCAGTPTGTPTTYTGRAPIVVDTTNNKLYFYSGGQWRDAGP